MKNRFFYRSLVLAAMAILACNPPEEGEDPQPQPQPVDPDPEIVIPAESTHIFTDGISFTTPDPEQMQTATVKFSATDAWQASVTDTKASTWLSVDPSGGTAGVVVMTVTAQPNLTEKEREAAVTVSCGEDTHSFTVSQTPYVKPPVDVESVTLDKDRLTLVKGQSATLTATVLPADADDKTVTWASSNANVVSVDQNGKVTATGGGSATISATTVNDITAQCQVTVTVPVSSVTLSQPSLSLLEGRTAKLEATVLPEDATDKTVTWTSSIPAIATVSADGTVTAVSAGKVNITAKAGEISAVCSVTVEAIAVSVAPASVELDAEGGKVSVKVTSNVSWTASSAVQWFTLSKTSASEGETQVEITIKENETVDARSATVTFTAEGRTATLSVSQKGIVPELSVTGPTEKLPASAGTYQLSVTSNIAWTLASSESWLTTSVSSSAKGTVNVSFSVTQNDSTSERTATLTFTYGGKTFTHSVTQKARDDISGFTGSIEDWEDEGAEFNKK